MLSFSIALFLFLAVLTAFSCSADKKSKKQNSVSKQKSCQTSKVVTPLMPRSSPMSPCQTGKTSNGTSSKEKSASPGGPSPILKPDVTQVMDLDEELPGRFSEAEDEDNTVDDATSLRGVDLDVPSECLLVKGAAKERQQQKSAEIYGEPLKKKPSVEMVVEATVIDTDHSVREKRKPKKPSLLTARRSLSKQRSMEKMRSMEKSRDMITAVEKRGARKEGRTTEKSKEPSRRRNREIERKSRELRSVEKTKETCE